MIRIKIKKRSLNEGAERGVINFVDPEPEENWDAIGWTPNMVDKINEYTTVWMSPQEFLEKVDPSFMRGGMTHSDKSDEFLMTAVHSGRKFTPLQMWPKKQHGGIMQHEGRHRALLAMNLGMTKVPVIVWEK